jgi:hypothetical protein
MKENSKTEKHHYVSRCYLKNFVFDEKRNLVYAYQRKKPVIKASISNIAAKKNLYIFLDKTTGKKTNIVEEMFGILEAAACPVIKKIVRTQELNLDEKEKGALAQFIAFLATRTISFDAWQKNMSVGMQKQLMIETARNKDHLKASFKRAGIKFKNEEELKDMRQSILDFDKHFKVEFKRGEGYFFKIAAELAMELTQILFNKHWHLLISNTSRVFITSDNPVAIQKVKGVPFQFNSGFMYGTVLLTLSPLLCLLIRFKPLNEEIIQINRVQVDSVNKSIMLKSGNFIYSNISSRDIKNTYDDIPEGQDREVIIKKIKNTPYIIGTGPEIESETISG